MKYLPLADFDTVNNALNFSTPDCHVIGGCDLYTTKAAGGDKKLYKNIDSQLETQYQSLVRLSTSLSPPYMPAPSFEGSPKTQKKRSQTMEPPEIDLSRSSPFGPLSQITARRTFAYLIATLNASHTDYDFSHQLRPSDFHKERSLRSIVQNVDSALQNLRPKHAHSYLAPPVLSNSAPPIANSVGNEIWSPRMWTLINKEMDLRQCEKYTYAPDDDPFDGEEGAIWSMHYFFFNKEKKRVCYLYLRGLSVISHSPVHAPVGMRSIRRENSSISVGEGAGKRASYWLGVEHGDDVVDSESYLYDEDDDVEMGMTHDDETEGVPYMDLDDIRGRLVDGYFADSGPDDDDSGGWQPLQTRPRHVREFSEEIGEAMDM
nr:repressor of rna polymerase iii transcription maf1 [Quercus suber]